MALLDTDARYKLAKAIASMRSAANALLRVDSSHSYLLDKEADSLETVLDEDTRRQDQEDALRECRYREWLEEQRRYTDEDLELAGLPPGGTDLGLGSILDQMSVSAWSSGSKRILEVVYFAVLFPGRTVTGE